MKTLKTLSVTLLFLVSMLTRSFGNDEPNAVSKLSMDYALKTYIEAVSLGKIKGFSDVLDNDVKFTVTRGEKIIHYSKFDMLNSLKNTTNVKQNCNTTYNIVEQNKSQAVVKVTMKYESFSKINYVTLANTTRGWKITNVSSSFS